MQTWVKIHRWLGLFASVFLLVAAVTGCVLCFAKPLDRTLNADLFYHTDRSQHFVPFRAVEALQRARPGLRVTGFPLNVPESRNITLEVAAKPGQPPLGYDELFLDGGDGHVVGTRATGPAWNRRGLVTGIQALHENLLASDPGRLFLGAVALAWLIGAIIGVYLTWPQRRPVWKHWRRMWRFSFKSPIPRLMLDLHRSSGLWLLIGIVPLAATSVCLSFYYEAYEPAVEAVTSSPPGMFDAVSPYPKGEANPTLRPSEALARAKGFAAAKGEAGVPATMVYLPRWNVYGITFTDNGMLNYHGLGPPYYYVDARTGALAYIADPYSGPTDLKMIRALYPLHSGHVAGWLGVAVIFILGLATTEMIVSGLYVWWKKRKSRVAAKQARKRREALA